MTPVKEVLKQHITAKEEERKTKRRSGKYSPSSLGRCFRYQFWNRKNEEPSNPISTDVQGRFLMGNLIDQYLKDLYPKEQTTQSVGDDDFYGYPDLVEDDCVTDFKSTNDWAYKKMSEEKYDVVENKKENWLQVAFYAHKLNKPKVRLCFINTKDVFRQIEWVFHTSRFMKDLTAEINTLISYWTKDELPDAEPRTYGGKECQYCIFQDKCKEKGGKVWNKQ